MTITGGVFSADVSITMNNNVCEIKEFNNDVIKCMAPKSVSSLTLIEKMVQNHIYNVWTRSASYLYFYHAAESATFTSISSI